MARLTLAQQIDGIIGRADHQRHIPCGRPAAAPARMQRFAGAFEEYGDHGVRIACVSRSGRGPSWPRLFYQAKAPITLSRKNHVPILMDTIWLMRQQFVREPGHSPLGEGFPAGRVVDGSAFGQIHPADHAYGCKRDPFQIRKSPGQC